MEARIIFVDEKLKEAFYLLKKSDKRLYKEISRALVNIKNNVWIGRNVKKKLIPINIVQKFKINNLWKYNLPSAWRLFYTIIGNEIKIVSVILDWMNHKDYERLFKF